MLTVGTKYQISVRQQLAQNSQIKPLTKCRVQNNFIAPLKKLIINATAEPQIQGSGDIPEELRDPITLQLMTDPVRLTETGDVYDRESLDAWFARHGTCPKTLKTLRTRQYVPDAPLKQRCDQYAQAYRNGTSPISIPYTDEIHVYVRGLSQKTHTIAARPDDGIQTLKAKISDKIGLPPREFNVNFNGRQLSTGTLRSNNITDEAHLVMTVNFQGGHYNLV